MTVKWFSRLVNFRNIAAGVNETLKTGGDKLEALRKAVDSEEPHYQRTDLGWVFVTPAGTYRLNWRAYPVFTGWVDWPYFAVSVVTDPIEQFVRAAVRRLRAFFEWTAKIFEVK